MGASYPEAFTPHGRWPAVTVILMPSGQLQVNDDTTVMSAMPAPGSPEPVMSAPATESPHVNAVPVVASSMTADVDLAENAPPFVTVHPPSSA